MNAFLQQPNSELREPQISQIHKINCETTETRFRSAVAVF